MSRLCTNQQSQNQLLEIRHLAIGCLLKHSMNSHKTQLTLDPISIPAKTSQSINCRSTSLQFKANSTTFRFAFLGQNMCHIGIQKTDARANGQPGDRRSLGFRQPSRIYRPAKRKWSDTGCKTCTCNSGSDNRPGYTAAACSARLDSSGTGSRSIRPYSLLACV